MKPIRKISAQADYSNHIFCEACGDCIYCYGEDRCYKTEDGEHVLPPPERPTHTFRGHKILSMEEAAKTEFPFPPEPDLGKL